MSDRYDDDVKGLQTQRSSNWCDWIRNNKLWVIIIIIIILALLWWFFMRKKDTGIDGTIPNKMTITKTRGPSIY